VLFWETPHDPKGSLRWALSRLRGAFNTEHKSRIIANRDFVSFDMTGLSLETQQIDALIQSRTIGLRHLMTAKKKLSQKYLSGIDLSNLDEFSLWLAEQRTSVERLNGKLLKRCIDHPGLLPNERVQFAREWLDLDPFNPDAAKSLINALMRENSIIEANKIKDSLEIRFKKAGIDFNYQNFTPDTSQVTLPIAINKSIGSESEFLPKQKIQFCKTSTGVNLAYARVGQGPPLVKAANWLTHLELDWSAPIWSPLYQELARDFTFIRYDERGNGLSD